MFIVMVMICNQFVSTTTTTLFVDDTWYAMWGQIMASRISTFCFIVIVIGQEIDTLSQKWTMTYYMVVAKAPLKLYILVFQMIVAF